MNTIWRKTHSDDRGSIILALLAVIILTGVATVGLATAITGQTQTRRDNAFTQSLNSAETGLDSLVAEVKANPTAASIAPLTGTDPKTGSTYSGTAVCQTSGGCAGATATWLVKASGTASRAGHAITRTVEEKVDLTSVYSVPLFGKTALNVGNNSGVNTYTNNQVGSATAGNEESIGSLLGLSLINLWEPKDTTPGDAATDGTFTVTGTQNTSDFSQVGLNGPAANGNCNGSTCPSNVVPIDGTLNMPAPAQCANGIDVGENLVNGSGNTVLSDGAVYDILSAAQGASPLILNTNMTQNLATGQGDMTLCTDLPITIPSLPTVGGLVTADSAFNMNCLPVTIPLSCVPNDPETFNLIEEGTGALNFGTSGTGTTILSGVIYAPNASCTITGNVIIYGTLICGSVNAGTGASLTINYDDELQDDQTLETVEESNWTEIT
jgi:type II secretory pathway pseudopilin PulG